MILGWLEEGMKFPPLSRGIYSLMRRIVGRELLIKGPPDFGRGGRVGPPGGCGKADVFIKKLAILKS
jgi:hypothetical protein